LPGVRIERGVSVQEQTCQGEEAVGNAADGTAVRMTAFPQSGIAGTALQIVLDGDACPVIDGTTQSYMRCVAQRNDVGLAAAFDTGATPDKVLRAL
jgi:hypothetical protein